MVMLNSVVHWLAEGKDMASGLRASLCNTSPTFNSLKKFQ